MLEGPKASSPQRVSQAVPHARGASKNVKTPSESIGHLQIARRIEGLDPEIHDTEIFIMNSLKGRTNRSNAGKISVDRSTRLLSHLQYPDSTKSSAKDLSEQHRNL